MFFFAKVLAIPIAIGTQRFLWLFPNFISVFINSSLSFGEGWGEA
jgi:hypothetical protein